MLCVVAALPAFATSAEVDDSLMRELDDVIARRDDFLAVKKAQLDSLERAVRIAADDRGRFDALVHLYEAYHSFNVDSAYSISLQQEAVARRIDDPVLVTNARLNRAELLSATGMYHEALAIMDSVRLASLPDYLHPYYYHIKRTVYGRMADYAAFGPERRQYDRLTDMYRDSIIAVNPPNTLAHVITKADCLNVKGRPGEAVRVLEAFIRSTELPEHDRAICAWTLSESYGLMGDRAAQKEQLLVSSIADMRSSVREYVSLRQLALMLYEEGDLDRAYSFMNIAVDDAAKCNARQRIVELNASYPKINSIYVHTVRTQKRWLEWTIVIITVLSLVLLAALLYVRKQMNRIARARKETDAAYRRLEEMTCRLKASNAALSDANNSIAEISELKEVYIGRYMDQCMVYIEKLDAYRKSIGRLLKTGKSDELKELVKSAVLTDDELKMFYEQFDRTFLRLFPTFVEDLNSLLLPEEAIVPKRAGSLNTELRIFALIRLGITDSDKIAKFLRYSLTTIYNYRTKVRNKARGDRSLLEAEVMKIGRARRPRQGANEA